MKSARNTAVGRPFERGHDPRRGVGRPGRSGRKALAFIAECEGLADGVVLEKIRALLHKSGPEDPAWRWAVDRLLEYCKSKPPARIEQTGEPTLNVVFSRE